MKRNRFSKPASHRSVPEWTGALLAGGAFLALFLLELRRPLRKRATEPKLTRNARNVAFAAISAGAMQLCERAMLAPFTKLVEDRRWGLLKMLRLPRPIETLLAVLFLDYMLYAWHVLAHRVPFFWCFHQVHHCDLDMDASTAIRFHFGELGLSIPPRAAQILFIGASPLALSVWQTALLVSIMFHHSNVKLPLRIERLIGKIIVTPRMHGIHHSMVAEEMNSNWSSGLTLWDILHGTLRLDVPQNEITIGVASLRNPDEVRLPHLIGMPFSGAPASLCERPPQVAPPLPRNVWAIE